jgi:hypothetical protein
MPKANSILDQELESETEQTFHRTSIARKLDPKISEAFKKAEAKKQKETLPAPVPSNDLQVWYRNLTLRTYTEPDFSRWFCLADVCKVLGYKDSDQARKNHCLGETIVHKPENSTKKLCYISEGDLYNLILRSNSPVAIPFRKFVTGKVLPALREKGRYCMTEEMAEHLAGKHGDSLVGPIEGEQLELFPITAKQSLTFKPIAMEKLATARDKLRKSGTEFSTYSDFLSYLIGVGLVQVGVSGFEYSGDNKK